MKTLDNLKLIGIVFFISGFIMVALEAIITNNLNSPVAKVGLYACILSIIPIFIIPVIVMIYNIIKVKLKK